METMTHCIILNLHKLLEVDVELVGGLQQLLCQR